MVFNGSFQTYIISCLQTQKMTTLQLLSNAATLKYKKKSQMGLVDLVFLWRIAAHDSLTAKCLFLVTRVSIVNLPSATRLHDNTLVTGPITRC